MAHMLLSHHYPQEYDRCLKIVTKHNTHYLCARCTGYFSSFLIALPLLFLMGGVGSFAAIFYFFPMFAIVDWALAAFKLRKGSNTSRYLTGFLLGLSGAYFWFLFLNNPFDKSIYIVIIPYSLIIAALMAASHRHHWTSARSA